MNKVELKDLVGGAWKNAAMNNIKNYLEFELAEFKQFTVIS